MKVLLPSSILKIRLPSPLFIVWRRVVAAGVDREQVRARAVDRERIRDLQLTLGERDRGRAAAGERRGEIDRVRAPTRLVAKIASRSDVRPSSKSTVSLSV